MKAQGKFSEIEFKKYVEKYMNILERNESAVYQRLSALADVYIHMDESIDPETLSQDQKIKAVN